MIQHTIPLSLTLADHQQLRNLQQLVDVESDYANRVELARQKWNNKPSTLFERIRTALADICLGGGTRRCSYCEDSLADEIEHIRPKNWFPNQVFDPLNYLFACGPCNGPKNNQYAVVSSSGIITEAVRTRGSVILPPPLGQEALLNPWEDNPADFFFLDLQNTFEFKPKASLNNHDATRAAYTLRILKINKDPLNSARRAAFSDFAGRLKEYHLALRDNESLAALMRMQSELLLKQHITVWHEMQRQANQHISLQRLFRLVPGAIHW